MKLNLSIELQSTIKARATTDRTLLLRLSTPSVFGERPALGVLLNFLSHTRTHSRKGTIVISGWKGLIYFAGLKERMYGPVMTWGLAANNEDSIRAGHRQDAISLYTVHITPVRLMSSPSFLGKRGKLAWRTRLIPALLFSPSYTLIQYWTYSPLYSRANKYGKPNKMIPAVQYFFFFQFQANTNGSWS